MLSQAERVKDRVEDKAEDAWEDVKEVGEGAKNTFERAQNKTIGAAKVASRKVGPPALRRMVPWRS